MLNDPVNKILKMLMNKSAGSIYYICDKCAKKNGGVWPLHHAATLHAAGCDICGKVTHLASTGDYDWPKGKPANFEGGRD